MSQAITGVLKFAFGLISNKVRSYGAEKLQDGGLTDQKFRGWIVRELDDILFKLDGLSRKDLSSSISFLKQGVQRLQMSFGECSESGNPSTSELPKEGKQSQAVNPAVASSTETKPDQQSATVEDALALANAIGKLKIESKERFESAKESFKKAAEKACEAFHNTALSTNERILASKVRITSGILEHVDDPKVAASDCLQYLQELHDMPAIQEIFSVHIQGGIKSLFKKDSRAEIVETITIINLVLADFISKFTKRRMGVFDWPVIECGKRVVHPIYYEKESVEKTEISPPWNIVTHRSPIEEDQLRRECAINSKGDIIGAFVGDNHLRKLDRATGEWQPFCLSPPDDEIGLRKRVAIDDNDVVYVVSYKYSSNNPTHTLYMHVYSSDGQIINHCPLDFIEEGLHDVITVTKDKSIVICSFKHLGYQNVYVCDIIGELIKSFPIHLKSANENVCDMFVSCDNSTDNEIAVATVEWPFFSYVDEILLYLYTQGELKRNLRLLSLGWIYGTTFDHVTKNYIVCSEDWWDNKISVECFSETGERRNVVFLDGKDITVGEHNNGRLISHPNGAMAFVNSKCVLYLRSSFM